MNCTIRREKKSLFWGVGMQIYIDGLKSFKVKNGKSVQIPLSLGKHKISFEINNKIMSEVDVNVESETQQFDIICWCAGVNEIEVVLTNQNVDYHLENRGGTRNSASTDPIVGTYLVLKIMGMVFSFIVLYVFFSVFLRL